MSWACVYRTPTVEGDHAKYATEYAKFGVHIYCNEDVAQKKQFPYNSFTVLRSSATKSIGSFRVCPIELYHDVPNYGYMVQHPDMGTLLFVTDTYKVPIAITGIDHYLIEANYSDELLKKNVWNGKINKAQADRIMLSHMSLEYTVKYLLDCQVGSAGSKTKTITLCHLSERNSDASHFCKTVVCAFGIPCYIAQKGMFVELYRELI